jgi:signal transduction histidine kinase/ActR/RegA family two-component response regulator
MKTRNRLLYILTICVILFCVSAFTLERVISNKVALLLEKRLEHISEEANKLLILENSSIKSYVTENSYWDELCNSVLNKDTAWIAENMKASLKTPLYSGNFLWVTDSAGNTVYNQVFNAAGSGSGIEAPTPGFVKSFNPAQTSKFCFRNGNVYFEGYAASVVHGNDFAKKTKPTGYLLAGKVLNQDYLDQLHNLNTDFEYSFEPFGNTVPADVVNKKEALLTCYKTIACLNGPPAVIRVTNRLPEIKAYTLFVKMALICYFIFVLVITIILGRYFFQYFFRPLDRITMALEGNNTAPLINIVQKDTEMGRIAKLIKAFFKQKSELQAEIEHRKTSEAELKLAAEKLHLSTVEKIRAEQAAQAKGEFLATMSHEIRTPINGVIGIANLLKDEPLTPRQKEYVDILSYSSKHLLSLISDILDFSKIETGKLEFDNASFSLDMVCQSVFQVFKLEAQKKNLAFTCEPDPAITTSLYGDSVRLNQVLTNLVGNAIKFTSSGSVSFGYKLLSKTASNCNIEFTVKDSGIGIAGNEQSKIFDGFSQANHTISTNFGGSGLGLAISKKMIELQGGKLTMQSELGKGTTFTFYLSFETHAFDPASPAAAPLSVLNKKALNGMKVLVAEDNSINVVVIRRFLEKWEVHYKIARNGKEAVELACNEDFDLVLMDIHMPEMNGEDATTIIRENTSKKISAIPIIALTANASLDAQQKLLSNGFTNYISKPFNPDSLFRLLSKYYYDN